MNMRRWMNFVIGGFALLLLAGCEQVTLMRQWWDAWQHSTAPAASRPQAAQNVGINIDILARQHPAWQLAEILASTPPQDLALQWEKPPAAPGFSEERAGAVITDNEEMGFQDIERPATLIDSDLSDYQTALQQEGRQAWEQWEARLEASLAKDRENISRTMRVDLYDEIARARNNIPETSDTFLLSQKLQMEMINLRLKLLNNIALAPDDKAEAEQRLKELEAQWTEQLRLQAQSDAERQRFWRETVPAQMRTEGEAKINRTLQALQQQDQKTLREIITHQQTLLDQEDGENSLFSLQQPAVRWNARQGKSTFAVPLALTRVVSETPAAGPPPSQPAQKLPAPAALEIAALKKIARAAALRAANRSALRHQWDWIDSSRNAGRAPLRTDVTNTVLQEASFAAQN